MSESEDILEKLETSTILEPYIQDIEIIQNNSGKFIQLINSTNPEFKYELKNKFYTFNFKEAIYVQKIIFTIDDEINLNGLELISIDTEGNENATTFSKGHSIWLPNRVIKGFKFKAPKRLINKIKLNKVEIIAFTLDDFSEIKDKVKQVSEYKTELSALVNDINTKNEKLDARVNEIEIELSDKREFLNTLKSEIAELEVSSLPPLRDEYKQLLEEVNQSKTIKNSLKDETISLTNNITQLETKSSTLNQEISKKESELKKLTDDTSVFSSEMKEYIEQGDKDIKLYTGLSLIPWILIILVTYTVFFGSSNLSKELISLLQESEKIDISTVFLLRLPFVIITITILFVSYEISKMFIQNIIHIQKQRRTFAKIGIMAKDIADSSIEGLDIKEKEKFELRTKLKMDLLKSHLTNDIGEKYEYKINTSLLEILKEHIFNKPKKD
ncbi:MAG TPA: hypothetical protein EYG85_04350 [Crocinitomix sp.]|nr:hypothetical protein [Crocinitomix sp.]